eukprot:1160608-Pelagomonas_calceolata.AAC.1
MHTSSALATLATPRTEHTSFYRAAQAASTGIPTCGLNDGGLHTLACIPLLPSLHLQLLGQSTHLSTEQHRQPALAYPPVVSMTVVFILWHAYLFCPCYSCNS